MTSSVSRTTTSRRSCPLSDLKLQSELLIKINPEFDSLSSKSDRLPFPKRGDTFVSTPEGYKELLLSAIAANFERDFPQFHSFCSKWVASQWKDARINLQSRLTKLSYLEPTLSFEPFAAIEKEIRLEWRRNHLLKGFAYIWTHMFRTQTFPTLLSVKQYYNAFTNTFLTVSYALFQRCLQPLIDKGFPVKMKLQRQTAVALVTELKEWREIYDNKISPLFTAHTSFSENFHLESIQANPRIIDINTTKNIFHKTAKSLENLIGSLTMEAMTGKLQQFRSNLLREMEESIEAQRGDKKHVTVEKQDVLGCIIYTLVKHKLDSIGNSLEYLSFLLGKDVDEVLRWNKVDCFRTDLEAAYWFVSQPVIRIDMNAERAFQGLPK